MRKLIMWNLMSLDGCFEGTEAWDLAFHDLVWGEELQKISLQQLNSADYLVFGRRTYQGMADYWKTAKGEIARYMNNIPKLVFSRSLESVDWMNSTLAQENPSDAILRLKAEGDGNMFVFGSADLSETLIKEELFDEYRIVIAPMLLGEGRSLFSKGMASTKLTLDSTQELSTGGVILRYKS